MRTKYIDPDFRPKPRTPVFCCVCYKDLAPSRSRLCVLLINGGMEAVHPDDWNEGVDAGGFTALIGPDCADRIGREWTSYV